MEQTIHALGIFETAIFLGLCGMAIVMLVNNLIQLFTIKPGSDKALSRSIKSDCIAAVSIIVWLVILTVWSCYNA